MTNRLRRRFGALTACIAALVAALACAAAVGATVYKCTNPAGDIEYRDRPCEAAATQSEIAIATPPAAPPAPASSVVSAASPEKAAAPPAAEPKDCSTWAPPPYTVEVTAPPEPDFTGFPTDAEGRPILATGAGIDLVAAGRDKPDPMTVQSTCSAMIDHCFLRDKNPRNSMDACFNSAPRCRTERPWEESKPCCPQSCWQKYAELRHRCVDPFSASTKALFDEHCVPGVAEMLQGRTPP